MTPAASVASVAHVSAEGPWFDLGVGHGSALRERLRMFLDDGVARLNHLLTEPVTVAALAPTIAAYRAEIVRSAPPLAEEIRGLAHGAGLTLDEATLLQLRREILGYHRIPASGDCTTYARPGVLAQTVDLNGNLDDQIAVLRLQSPGGPACLVLSFGGLLGYLGVNEHGLAVGINIVLGGTWGPGLPPYLAVRHLLETATSVDSALAALRPLRLSSSRCLTLADSTTTAMVEILEDRHWRLTGPESSHTNHFLSTEFAPRDELNVFAGNSSRRRLAAARSRLAGLGQDASHEDHFAVLAEPPITVPDNGDIRRERTVAAVVLDGASRALHLRPGDPRRSATQTFVL